MFVCGVGAKESPLLSKSSSTFVNFLLLSSQGGLRDGWRLFLDLLVESPLSFFFFLVSVVSFSLWVVYDLLWSRLYVCGCSLV